MTWRAALGDPYPEVDRLQHGGQWLGLLPPDKQKLIGKRLAALPLAIEVETEQGIVGLIHAECPFDDWHEMHRVRWDQIDYTGAVADCCMWSIGSYYSKHIGEVQNVRAVVHGHVTVSSAEVLGNTHFIDTGGWKPGGQFTFLDLATLVPIRGVVNAKALLNLKD